MDAQNTAPTCLEGESPQDESTDSQRLASNITSVTNPMQTAVVRGCSAWSGPPASPAPSEGEQDMPNTPRRFPESYDNARHKQALDRMIQDMFGNGMAPRRPDAFPMRLPWIRVPASAEKGRR